MDEKVRIEFNKRIFKKCNIGNCHEQSMTFVITILLRQKNPVIENSRQFFSLSSAYIVPETLAAAIAVIMQ